VQKFFNLKAQPAYVMRKSFRTHNNTNPTNNTGAFNMAIHTERNTHTHTHTNRERERKKDKIGGAKILQLRSSISILNAKVISNTQQHKPNNKYRSLQHGDTHIEKHTYTRTHTHTHTPRERERKKDKIRGAKILQPPSSTSIPNAKLISNTQ